MAGGFRRFRVAAKVPESDVITSFYLEPADGGPLWDARPGQYLTLRVPAKGGAVLRTYSLSCDVAEPSHHRITVKREGRPSNGADMPDGVGSCWLHDHVETGAEIEVAAPRGAFVLNEGSDRPVVLLAGGVGLTPLLSMLHGLAATDRRAWFVQACENGAVHAMGDEVRKLVAASGGRIRAHTVYRSPTADDLAAGLHQGTGFIDRAVLQALLPLDDYEFYMCGPTPFMVAMYRLLREFGVPKHRIAYEFFGKATSLEALAETPAAAPKVASRAPSAIAGLAFLTNPGARAVPDAMPKAAADPEQPATLHDGDTALLDGDVVFARSGASAQWRDAAGSLLELAEEAGLAPEFSCRAGICNTCRCKIVEGDVTYFEDPLDPPPAGEVLICCSRPVGRVVLDI